MRRRRNLSAIYLFASTLPDSTAGWSKGSTPNRCPARMVSSIKCIISAPSAPRRAAQGRWCAPAGRRQQGLGRRGLAAATRSPAACPGDIRHAASLARSERREGRCRRSSAYHGDHAAARRRDRAEAGCADRPAQAPPRRGALALLAEALAPELDVPGGEAREPVAVGHHHAHLDAALLGKADGDGGADGRREVPRRHSCASSLSITEPAPSRRASTSSPRASAGQKPDIGEAREAAADVGIVSERGDR